MELQFIDVTECPDCNCSEIIEESVETGFDGKIREHTMGGRWEHRKFACGYMVKYTPNFSRCETEKKCPRNEEELRKKKMVNDLKEKIYKFCDENNLTDRAKSDMTFSVGAHYFKDV